MWYLSSRIGENLVSLLFLWEIKPSKLRNTLNKTHFFLFLNPNLTSIPVGKHQLQWSETSRDPCQQVFPLLHWHLVVRVFYYSPQETWAKWLQSEKLTLYNTDQYTYTKPAIQNQMTTFSEQGRAAQQITSHIGSLWEKFYSFIASTTKKKESLIYDRWKK